MKRIFTLFVGTLIYLFVFSAKMQAQNGCACWQQRDTSYHPVPFAADADGPTPYAPYFRNDDGYTRAIVLPFHFCFWGREMDSVFINNNGNISFGTFYSAFTSDTFPTTIVGGMIAPFWADVDTRPNVFVAGWDVVYYQITSTHMVVQWDSVGLYEANTYKDTDKLNSFQLIITNGNDPILPKGNNVEFCYKNMHWTTGDASPSGDTSGFMGDPATVGANQGDGTRFIQIGLFDTAGSKYTGQYPAAPAYDGVAWLDNKSFLFNLCAGTIAPLTSGVSPCDTFKICLGDSVLIPFYFFSPIQGDSVWSNLSPPIPSGVSIVSNKPGPTDSLTVKIVGNSFNVGYHTINVYGYDNASPQDTTYTSFVVEVDTAPVVHLNVRNDTICAGDTAFLNAFGGKYYTWSTGATTSSIEVTPAFTQTYTVGISDGGCFKDTMLQVVVLPTPAPKITAIPDTICPKDSVLLIASGGGPYKWSTGQTKDSIWVNPDSTKTYSLYASNGICSDSTKISVFVKTPGKTTLTHTTDTLCPNIPFTLTASGGASYLWSNGATTSSITVNPDSTTTYTVYSNVTCALDSLKQKVVIIPLPTPVIKGTSWKCLGKTDTLYASGGTTYLWSNGSTSTKYITKGINADSTVTLIAYNSLGCADSTQFNITLRLAPTVTINPPTLTCANSPVVLTATASGTGTLSYKWSPGGETTDSITVEDSVATTYSLTVSNGCTTLKTTTVKPVNPPLNACCDKTILVGDDTIIGSFGKTLISYSWSPSVTCKNPPLCDTVMVNPTVTTTYTVTGTDSNGCQVERVVTIVVETPCFNFTVPNVFTPDEPGPLGLNEVFYIKTTNVEAWSIVIYDRWGKEMFKSTNPNEFWAGTTEGGAKAPDGVYYYLITGSCQANTYKKDGFVQLIR